jgi:hypothetical protein
MSLEQVNAFYDVLTSDQTIYEQYYHKCCVQGCFGIWNWDRTKIVSFAASLGYIFNENELDAIWFGNELSLPETSPQKHSEHRSQNRQSRLHQLSTSRFLR